MTLIEICNLSAAELKERRAELADAAKGIDPAELAARFVQSLTDAKARDEKLAEQGKTIQLLQSGLEAEAGKVRALGAELQRMADNHNAQQAELNGLVKRLNDEVVELTGDLQEQKDLYAVLMEKASRYRALAGSARGAINQAASVLNAALAQFQLADADGE